MMLTGTTPERDQTRMQEDTYLHTKRDGGTRLDMTRPERLGNATGIVSLPDRVARPMSWDGWTGRLPISATDPNHTHTTFGYNTNRSTKLCPNSVVPKPSSTCLQAEGQGTWSMTRRTGKRRTCMKAYIPSKEKDRQGYLSIWRRGTLSPRPVSVSVSASRVC